MQQTCLLAEKTTGGILLRSSFQVSCLKIVTTGMFNVTTLVVFDSECMVALLSPVAIKFVLCYHCYFVQGTPLAVLVSGSHHYCISLIVCGKEVILQPVLLAVCLPV